MLTLAYAVQVASAVWTVYRAPAPSGVGAARWVLVGIGSAAIVARNATTRHLGASARTLGVPLDLGTTTRRSAGAPSLV